MEASACIVDIIIANKYTWTKDELNAYDYVGMREQDGRGKLTKAEQRGEKTGEKKCR